MNDSRSCGRKGFFVGLNPPQNDKKRELQPESPSCMNTDLPTSAESGQIWGTGQSWNLGSS